MKKSQSIMRTAAKKSYDKDFDIAKSSKYDGSQRCLDSMVSVLLKIKLCQTKN